MTLALHLGDCLDVMRTLPDASVDAVVTDPPYGLAFMGKRWDYDVPTTEVWAECLRVMKPGGHLLAFAGTRTQHRMAVRIEDAGFEIRDMIAWAYGSGFPKSLDVSKAIDKMDAADEQMQRRYRFTEWVRATGATSRQIDEATGTNMGGHYTTAASQPAIMTREHLERCRHLLGDVPEWVEREADIRSVESRNFAEREVVGVHAQGSTPGGFGDHRFSFNSKDITAPATPEAQQWSGWGTALKPALEPITMARKPLVGTVAANVLAHGTGGLNVDGCRVEGQWSTWKKKDGTVSEQNQDSHAIYGQGMGDVRNPEHPSGRWPANLIHDGSDEVVGLFPAARSSCGGGVDRKAHDTCVYSGDWGLHDSSAGQYHDTGSAARFFYTAKASKDDRDGGNTHPTVKPTDLMRYLCRLVTPPGGVVLDPFMGSGSTGKAAMLEGFGFIGIEREAAYHAIAERRIHQAGAAGHQPDLFTSALAA
jgi:DNA modification methylase